MNKLSSDEVLDAADNVLKKLDALSDAQITEALDGCDDSISRGMFPERTSDMSKLSDDELRYFDCEIAYPYRSWPMEDQQGVVARFDELVAYVVQLRKEAYQAGMDKAQEWLQIEGAPKDGTVVWVYAAPYEDLPGFQCCCGYHVDAGWCVDELREVTHYKPLPPPPNNTGA